MTHIDDPRQWGIDYDQLYAQVLHELRELNAPYWFDNAEVIRIQELNQNYVEQKDIAEIVGCCFRKPAEGEGSVSMNSGEIIRLIQKEYPSVKSTHSTKVHLGLAMKEMGFEHTHRGNVMFYKVVPVKVA